MTNGLTWVSNQAEAAGISIHPISVKKNNNNKAKQSTTGGPTAHIEATLNALKNETSFNQVQQGSVPDAYIQAPLRSETPKSILKTTTNFSGIQRDNCVPTVTLGPMRAPLVLGGMVISVTGNEHQEWPWPHDKHSCVMTLHLQSALCLFRLSWQAI